MFRKLITQRVDYHPRRSERARQGLCRLLLSGMICAGFSLPADAQEFNATRYSLSYLPTEMPGVWDGSVDDSSLPSGSLTVSYAHRLLYFHDTTNDDEHPYLQDRVTAEAAIAYGLLGRASLGLRFPVTIINSGEDGFVPLPSPEQPAVGDLRIGAKVRIIGSDEGFRLALGGELAIPTSTANAWTGEGGLSGGPVLVADWVQDSLQVAANLRYLARPEGSVSFYSVDDELALDLGVRFAPGLDWLQIITEVHLATAAAEPFVNDDDMDRLEGLAGVELDLGYGFTSTVMLGHSLLSGYGNTTFHALTRIGWSPASSTRASMDPISHASASEDRMVTETDSIPATETSAEPDAAPAVETSGEPDNAPEYGSDRDTSDSAPIGTATEPATSPSDESASAPESVPATATDTHREHERQAPTREAEPVASQSDSALEDRLTPPAASDGTSETEPTPTRETAAPPETRPTETTASRESTQPERMPAALDSERPTAGTGSRPERESSDSRSVESGSREPARESEPHTASVTPTTPRSPRPAQPLPDMIHFDFDSSRISREDRAELRALAQYLQDNPNVRLDLVGHACLAGSRDYNQYLSERRAQSVANRLIRLGVSRNRIEVRGEGMLRPLTRDERASEQARNRRTEIVIQ